MADLEIEEELAGTKLDRATIGRLAALIRPAWRAMLIVLLTEMVLVGTILLRPWFLRSAIDDGLEPIDTGGFLIDHKYLLWLSIGLLGTWVFRFVLMGLGNWVSGSMAISILNDLRSRLAAQVQALSMRYFDRTKAGRIVSRADSDVERLEALVVYGPPVFVASMARFVGGGLMLLIISPRIFFFVLPLIPVLFIVVQLFRKLVTRLWGRVSEERSRLTAFLVECINGIREQQQATNEDRARHHYQDNLHRMDIMAIRASFGWAWFMPFTLCLFTLGVCLVVVGGADAVATGELTIGELTQCMFYVFLFLAPLQDLGDLFERGSEGVAAAQRIFLLLDTKPDIVDEEDAKDVTLPAGHIRFTGVNFSYDPKATDNWILQDINLDIPAGQQLAIVGRTGHGKSTLVQLICRFYDVQQGRIEIDHMDLRSLQQQSLRRQIGIVLQDNVLFSGSVLDNLRHAAPEAADEQLIAACHDLGVDDVLERLPESYHTQVGPQGGHLSHGQRQLVCLVRAYLADPKVMILDEATSAVDIHTERRIQRALRRLCHGRTAIIIAHRLATIRDADRILVIHEGRIAEDGKHDGLMQSNGMYRQLYEQYQRGEHPDY